MISITETMFHGTFYDAPRTGINFFSIESFDLSARVGESLANCLSTLSVMASSENNDIFSSIRHNQQFKR